VCRVQVSDVSTQGEEVDGYSVKSGQSRVEAWGRAKDVDMYHQQVLLVFNSVLAYRTRVADTHVKVHRQGDDGGVPPPRPGLSSLG